MKLGYSLQHIADVFNSNIQSIYEELIDVVFYDTRKIYSAKNGLFFCLKSERRDGHEFIQNAIDKGVKFFVVDKEVPEMKNTDLVFFKVENTWAALHQLAAFHRQQFSYPVIAITGSTGKTTVKEWLFQLLSPTFSIVRSPKSYNSQLGVALSLLEMNSHHQLAIIEAGISEPGEMETLEKMIQPTIGILTNIGSAHLENFDNEQDLIEEKLKLFQNTSLVFVGNQLKGKLKAESKYRFSSELINVSLLDRWAAKYKENLTLVKEVSEYFLKSEIVESDLNLLPQLAMRMEVFDGINQNTIINDAYNLDLDALKQSLEFLVESNTKSKSIVIIVAKELQPLYKNAIENLVKIYSIDTFQLVDDIQHFDVNQYHNSTILIKGYRNSEGQKLAQQLKLQKHETIVEVDMDALRNNLNFFRSKIKPSTKLLVMVKAFAYGTGAEKIASFLERNNVDYLGVAYGDEGVILRNLGIKTPILVMNAEPFSYENIIEHQLEPAIFSKKSLEEFTKTLINLGKENYPIHLKIDTGMHRLGFSSEELPEVVARINSQPELMVKGVYSHLADADNEGDSSYSEMQIDVFSKAVTYLRENISSDFIAHILNTEGITKFPDAQFDMVRMGIGLYGFVSNPTVKSYLQPAIFWKTIISQIRELSAGQRISYNGRFETQRVSKIATIPVGYADGIKRSYGKNGGTVVVNDVECPIVGTICMDMCMIDVTDVDCREGDQVEIIGNQLTLERVAEKMDTIPYEVLTSISKRVHRTYINE